MTQKQFLEKLATTGGWMIVGEGLGLIRRAYPNSSAAMTSAATSANAMTIEQTEVWDSSSRFRASFGLPSHMSISLYQDQGRCDHGGHHCPR
jgi:hypothetical protein